jgi:hypothetical protein
VGQGLTDPEGQAGPALVGLADPPIPAVIAAVATIIIAFSPNPPPKPLLDVVRRPGLRPGLRDPVVRGPGGVPALRPQDRSGGRSLQANAYGMYLTHYVFTAWLSGCCCRRLGRAGQGLAVFGGAVALSWLMTMALRRMPLLGRIL